MKIEPHLEAMLAQAELRVLYGPQAGSRLPLAPGTYMLGTGDDCAIMLAGPRMRESHASLDFNGETPSVTPLDGSVFDAQGNEVEGTLELRLGMPVELGGVWITIDHVESEWPDPEEVAAIAGLASPPPTATEVTSTTQVAGETDASSGSMSRKLKHAWFATSTPVAGVALLGMLAFGMTLWLVQDPSATSETDVAPDAASHSTTAVALREAIARVAPEQNLSISQGADGTLKIVGYARDPASRDRILDAVRKHGGTPVVTIFVDSEMLDATRKVIESQANPRKMKVTATSVTNGRVELSGAVSSAALRDALAERIRNEVPGISNVSGGLLTAEDLSVVLQERIMTSGLGSKLQIIERQPEFVIRGRLNEQDIVKWESLLRDFGNEFASLLPIRATVSVAHRKPPVDVQMVVGGAMPFIVTEDGRRIGRGGDANGHTLSTVGDQEVIFDGSERFRIAR